MSIYFKGEGAPSACLVLVELHAGLFETSFVPICPAFPVFGSCEASAICLRWSS